MLERFRILGKFQARLVDLLNLQFSTLTKPTGLTKPESTKQMEQTLRAKVKIFFKSENLKKCF